MTALRTSHRQRSWLASLIPLLLLAVVGLGCNDTDEAALQEEIETLSSDLQTTTSELAAARDSIAALRTGAPQDMEQLGDAIRFPSGSAWITDQGRRTLDSLAAILDAEYDGRDFRIKGFTDDRPIGPRLVDTYPSNWYLSAQRAAAVAHYLDEQHGIRSRTLEIGAFGAQNPVASNETEEGRRQNRRVEIQVAAD